MLSYMKEFWHFCKAETLKHHKTWKMEGVWTHSEYTVHQKTTMFSNFRLDLKKTWNPSYILSSSIYVPSWYDGFFLSGRPCDGIWEHSINVAEHWTILN